MKWIPAILALGALVAIFYGLITSDTNTNSDIFIGIGTVVLFFVAMPLFLILRSKKSNLKDYMLTEENWKKMREKSKESQ